MYCLFQVHFISKLNLLDSKIIHKTLSRKTLKKIIDGKTTGLNKIIDGSFTSSEAKYNQEEREEGEICFEWNEVRNCSQRDGVAQLDG